MMTKMYAVVWEDEYGEDRTLVSVHLMREDASRFVGTTVNPEQYEVKEFEMDWGHWIECRKTLGIY